MSETLMVIATAVIAVFAGLSWYNSVQIKKDAIKKATETRELIIKLTAGIMASGKTVGEPKLAADLLVQHEDKLRDAIAKSKYPLA